MDYLNHVIKLQRMSFSSHTVETGRGLQAPSNIKELRPFFSLYNVFPRFVPNFASIAAPLNQKLRKDQPSVHT